MAKIISKISLDNEQNLLISPSTFFVCTDFEVANGDIYYQIHDYLNSPLSTEDIRLSIGTTIWINFLNTDFYNTSPRWKDYNYQTYFKFLNTSNNTLSIYSPSNNSSSEYVRVSKVADYINSTIIPFYPDSIAGKILSFTYMGFGGFVLNNPSSTDILYGTCTTSAGVEQKVVQLLPSTENTVGPAGNGTQLYVHFEHESMNASAPIDTPWSGNLTPYLKLNVGLSGDAPIMYNNQIIGTYSGLMNIEMSPNYSYYSTGIYTSTKSFWSAGDIVHFIYLNNAWHILEILDQGMASKSGSSYGYCNSARGSKTKYINVDNFTDKGPGTIISVMFSNGNDNSAIDLSVNGVTYSVMGENTWNNYTVVTFMQILYGIYYYWQVISVSPSTVTRTVLSSSNLTSTGSTSGTTAYCLDLSSVLTNVSIS